jgi:hypothetical protein
MFWMEAVPATVFLLARIIHRHASMGPPGAEDCGIDWLNGRERLDERTAPLPPIVFSGCQVLIPSSYRPQLAVC